MPNIAIYTAILAAVAALCWLGGWKFMLHLFKTKEKDKDDGKTVILSKKASMVLAVCSAVLLEALAAMFGLILVRIGSMTFFEALRALLVLCVLLFTAVIDFKLMIIPNVLTLFLLAVSVVTYIIEFIISPDGIMLTGLDALLGCAICFVIFFIGKMISRKGMGMGDIKMAAVMGLALGLNSALGCMLWSMIIASVTGIILLATKKMKTKSKIAMAPFFFAGTAAGHIMLAIGGLL